MALIPPSIWASSGLGSISPHLFPEMQYLDGTGDLPVEVSPGELYAVDGGILQTYLPNMYRKVIRSGAHPPFTMMGFIRNSRAVREGLVTPGFVKETLRRLLHCLAGNIESSETPNIELAQLLEDEFHRDQYRLNGNMALHLQEAFPHTRARWTALSSIAASCHSSRIRSVLAHFFIKRGDFIARMESPIALLKWTYALVTGCLVEADIVASLREILKARTSLLPELARMAQSGNVPDYVMFMARHVFPTLLAIWERMDGAEVGLGAMGRGRSLLRRGPIPRRHSWSSFPRGYGPMTRRGPLALGPPAMRMLEYPVQQAVANLNEKTIDLDNRVRRLEGGDMMEGYHSDGLVPALDGAW
jgi:hypothetical protein